MRTVTHEEVTVALYERWQRRGDQWYFPDNLLPNQAPYLRSEDEARGIIEVCLMLGTQVTDTIQASAWVEIVRRVAALEARLNGEAA